MPNASGYFLTLSDNRYGSFKGRLYETFAEPVPEFKHSRNIPLVCFIANKEGDITHIGTGKRGVLAGTDLRRLNVNEIFRLKNPIAALDIATATNNNKVKHYLVGKVKNGGLIANKSFEAFLAVFLKNATEAIPILDKYTDSRRIRIESLTASEKKSLAEQKEAVLTAMNIAGIDRISTQGWDYHEGESPSSFLDGIPQVKLREDSMIINDLTNIPGFNLIKTTKYSASIFKNNKTRLTVLLSNRLPLEELLGTDLIYFNEDFKCFILVQYKVMEKEKERFLFRLPNLQFSEEVERMESIFNSIKSTKSNGQFKDYRINENPFFIKICSRLEFDPDNIGLSSGMYIPIDYIKLLENDLSIEGERGGKAISFENIGRYFDNTAFKTIVEGGWIGTNENQSSIIEALIKEILENGRTAVLAIKKRMEITTV
jgi:hypothetical protein